jgi:hypothetical protein
MYAMVNGWNFDWNGALEDQAGASAWLLLTWYSGGEN